MASTLGVRRWVCNGRTVGWQRPLTNGEAAQTLVGWWLHVLHGWANEPTTDNPADPPERAE